VQQLIIKNLHFKYKKSAIPIFENLNIEFEKGWSCIVGSNGSGKSTLLKLISKNIKNENGTIEGNNLTYYCSQNTEFPPKNLEIFMLTYNTKAFKIRDVLKIKDSWTYEWNSLSPGEKKRLQLAIALFEEPDILLVDEPTNHLDNKSKNIVLNALKSFNGIGILVSHDREVLDCLSQSTIIVKNKNVITFKTSYSNAISEYKKNLEFLEKTQMKQNIEIKKIKKIIQSQKEKVSQSKKRFSKKFLDKNDSSSRDKINLAKLTGKDKNDTQVIVKLQSKQKQLLLDTIKTDKIYKLGIEFNADKSKNIFPITIVSNILKLSETKKLTYQTLIVNQNDKIGIIGENGSGKSSFLNNVLSPIDLKNEYLYIPQEITCEESKLFFEKVNNLPNNIKGEIYTITRKLSSDPVKLQDSFIPSPGEIRKLMIAKGLLENPSLIILDEPTNHMDLDSIISLELALKEYTGTLILISHDITFLDAVVTDIWEFKKENEDLYIIC
jgi:ATPase subunit of ABC transporter with duplicated ATPase domains